jgi:hypothetical protein
VHLSAQERARRAGQEGGESLEPERPRCPDVAHVRGGWADADIGAQAAQPGPLACCCPGTMLAAALLTLTLLGSAHACSRSTSYEAGIVCRISKSALLVCKYSTHLLSRLLSPQPGKHAGVRSQPWCMPHPRPERSHGQSRAFRSLS